MIACAVLDIIEKINAYVLRCKFPEFVKINSFGILVGLAFLIFSGQIGNHNLSTLKRSYLS